MHIYRFLSIMISPNIYFVCFVWQLFLHAQSRSWCSSLCVCGIGWRTCFCSCMSMNPCLLAFSQLNKVSGYVYQIYWTESFSSRYHMSPKETNSRFKIINGRLILLSSPTFDSKIHCVDVLLWKNSPWLHLNHQIWIHHRWRMLCSTGSEDLWEWETSSCRRAPRWDSKAGLWEELQHVHLSSALAVCTDGPASFRQVGAVCLYRPRNIL